MKARLTLILLASSVSLALEAKTVAFLTSEEPAVREVCVRKSSNDQHLFVQVKYQLRGSAQMRYSVGLFSAPTFPDGSFSDTLKWSKAPMWFCESTEKPIRFQHTDTYSEVCRPTLEDFDSLTGVPLDARPLGLGPVAQTAADENYEKMHVGVRPLDFISAAMSRMDEIKVDQEDQAKTLNYPHGKCVIPSFDYSSTLNNENGNQVCGPLEPGAQERECQDPHEDGDHAEANRSDANKETSVQ